MISTIKTTLASLLLLVMGMQMSAAQGLSAGDMAFAFGSTELGAVQAMQRSAPAPVALSAEEMEATEGEWLPLLGIAARAIGPARTWLRVGTSYSRSSGCSTCAIRWGSNAHHRQSIGSPTLRSWNQRLNATRLPGSSWRVQDPGHFHLWRR